MIMRSLPVTPFSKSEAQHAFRLLAFRRDVTETILARYLLTLERDQEEGFLEMAPLDFGSVIHKTSQLSHRHATEFGVRYLDLLHIASALVLGAKRFLTFDLRQRKLAKATGLDIKI
jgi:predicted nucleic acid-binding protein